MKRLILLGSLAAFAPTASSVAADYCAPLSQLQPSLTSCTENEGVLGEAAVLCLERFEADAELASRALAQSMRAAGATARDQESLLGNAEGNYAAAQARLTALIASGRTALAQVNEYRAQLVYPEDFEVAPSMGFTAEEFLASVPCYDENRRLLLSVAEDFSQKVAELERARREAQDRRSSSNGNKRGVGANAAAPAAEPARTRGQGAGQIGRRAKAASDITGTKAATP